MIDINYNDNKINIKTGVLSNIYKPEQLPLTFTVRKAVSQDVVWSVNLDSNMWANYPESEINDVIVTDAQGSTIFTYYWDLMEHGSIFYKSLWLYCKNLVSQGIHPYGLVVGTHDGEFGEWVPVIKENLSSALLVEASVKQYEKLSSNYKGMKNVATLLDLITTDGQNVPFFEGGRGYTNSVVERVIRSWETEEIEASLRYSTSINDLINEKIHLGIHWLHLDVEGLDAQLIMSLEEKNIPPFIIFEDFNLPENEKNDIYNWLRFRGFNLFSNGGICLANKL